MPPTAVLRPMRAGGSTAGSMAWRLRCCSIQLVAQPCNFRLERRVRGGRGLALQEFTPTRAAIRHQQGPQHQSCRQDRSAQRCNVRLHTRRPNKHTSASLARHLAAGSGVEVAEGN